MTPLSSIARDLMLSQHFDSLAHALLDFGTQKFESFCILRDDKAQNQISQERGNPLTDTTFFHKIWKQGSESDNYKNFSIYEKPLSVYFDLASLTKPLSLAAVFHHKSELFSEKEHWLLNHKGGLPAWGKLSRSNWKEELFDFKIISSEMCYSDYSALRLMLELEKKNDKDLEEICNFYWDEELCYWQRLPPEIICPATGYRRGKLIMGEVNDQNAWNLREFCSHAGLFSTVEGLARSLFSLDSETGFIDQMEKDFNFFDRKQRFLHGWDTIREEDSLAGKGCGKKTFGHLGFTGTSVWIDSEKRKGQIILTNGCHPWQHSRMRLNHLRRKLGEEGWARLR